MTFAVIAWAHLCGAHSQRKIEAFLKGETWEALREVFESLGFECSPTSPSDTTVQRMLKAMNHEKLASLIERLLWSLPRQSVFGLPNLYAADGKSRKAALTESGKAEIDVSLYDAATKVSIAKLAAGNKEGEAPIARDLIKKVSPRLEAGYISADAGIACREFAATVHETKHDFISFVKGNAGKIYDEMKDLSWQDADVWHSSEKGHGRFETRTTRILRIGPELVEEKIPSALSYPNGLVFGSIFRTRREVKSGKESDEQSFFLLSEKNGPLSVQVVDAMVRGHWGIENELHRHRDVELGEDDLARMSTQASRIIGSILDLAQWLAGGCGRGIRYFMEQFRASSVFLFKRWQMI